MITCIQIECFMPYFASIIMIYHVKIACYHKGIEQLMEREEMIKWRQPKLQESTTADVHDTQNHCSNSCNPNENALTPSLRVSTG